ncbi:hypothetical protein AWB75_03496 [Caballeronia catudaia]|uniref:Uncharacterized protein n=1 Tax=Caballeronia catudaia TaxID=1777136 RepID=A0A158BGY4_9BURK|nr:hypothetical protein [Caballeronia catudaia]SAK69321.1 hypothetical protein AWB75_03496 [Caballeronia catudaia]
MTAHDFSQFSWDEQEDVKAVLADRRLELRDFQITDNVVVPKDSGTGATRQISVMRITNGKKASYDTDHFGTWLTDFADAVDAGEFDD